MRSRLSPRKLTAVSAALTLGLGIGVAPAANADDDTDPGSPTVQYLQRLLQFQTVDPPGDTLAQAQYMQDKFDKLGLDTDIIQPDESPHSASFVARLKADNPTQPPILLAAHGDVVPVDKSGWSVPPFGGVVKDGWVYGRGAMDFKGGDAVFGQAVARLAQQVNAGKVTLDRDVILLDEDNEETGDYGTDWLAEHHWDKIRAGAVLNEGGWVLKDRQGNPNLVTISTRDKIYATLILTTKGTATHSSRPLPHSAIYELNKAIAKLASYDTPVTLNRQTRQYFTQLEKNSTGRLKHALHVLVTAKSQRARTKAGKRVVEYAQYKPLFHALMRNTFTPTIEQAGIKENVIPGAAKALINVRLIPGGSVPADVIKQLKAVIDDPGVKIRLELFGGETRQEARRRYQKATNAKPSPTDTDLYRALASSAKDEWPTARVASGLFEAGTDATAWREKGIPVYGIYPYPLDNDTLQRMHGNDERISVESLNQGTDMIYNTLLRASTTGTASASAASTDDGDAGSAHTLVLTASDHHPGSGNAGLVTLAGLAVAATGGTLMRRRLRA